MLGRADNSTELVKLMEDPPRGNRVGICGGIPTGLAAPMGFDGATNKKGVFFSKIITFKWKSIILDLPADCGKIVTECLGTKDNLGC